MILSITRDMAPVLHDPHNFKSFHLEVSGSPGEQDRIEASLEQKVRFNDASHAWVSAEMLRTMPGVHDDGSWQAAFDAMIKAARPHGWIRDEPTLAIKAHVMWLPSDSR